MDHDEFAFEESVVTIERDAPAGQFLVDWIDLHRSSDAPADPAWPCGSAIDVALDALTACRLELPWPAERCGLWIVTCRRCGFHIRLETAGRADDPCSVKIPCRLY
jgi:hypothetical protein